MNNPSKQGRIDGDPSLHAALLAVVRAHLPARKLRALLARALPGGRLTISSTLFSLNWIAALIIPLLLLVSGTAAAAGPEYRSMFDPAGQWGFLTPRLIIWIFAQLHLLFAAFVLAVPMFVVIIEVVGLLSKDKEQGARYNDLAHEFCKLLTTAFSVTSILGAVFTFACIYLYPKMFSFLADVFGPTMYLYSMIFFGESFSLYIYYYGWDKIKGWAHAAIGLVLNAFGITLMLIANAWTTFMMAPGGLSETGEIVDRSAAFWNFLLHPINIHRLIANLCMGGSVAAAYAAYRFLSTDDPAKRAHYDWMGYVGNFVAVLALLPLPFAGYYLGFEIYQYNQQLGIYMMGGVLSWVFIVQAVLIGALFFAANYYLWLGMDRIEGSERYRGWIKWLLGIITICVLVWATPKSLILTTREIGELGGTSHPVISVFGVMSAKNTAVNLIILATFLSFILYRRANKIATVEWAGQGKVIQAVAFGCAAAVVIVIGIGGYISDWWLESSKRIAMSPYQVIAVLICMIVVMTVDVLMFRGAKEVGQIHWGRISRRAQYALIFLAVTFTWTMGLMGFVRSSLRQHWHVYEVLKDTSAEAFTPALGPATIVVTAVVMLFFGLVAVIVWISTLGSEDAAPALPLTSAARWRRRLVIAGLVAAGVVVFFAIPKPKKSLDTAELEAARLRDRTALSRYAVTDQTTHSYQIPVERALAHVAANPAYLSVQDRSMITIDRSGVAPGLLVQGVDALLAFGIPSRREVGLVRLTQGGVAMRTALPNQEFLAGPVRFGTSLAVLTDADLELTTVTPQVVVLDGELKSQRVIALTTKRPVSRLLSCGSGLVALGLEQNVISAISVSPAGASLDERELTSEAMEFSAICVGDTLHVAAVSTDGALLSGSGAALGAGPTLQRIFTSEGSTRPRLHSWDSRVVLSWRTPEQGRVLRDVQSPVWQNTDDIALNNGWIAGVSRADGGVRLGLIGTRDRYLVLRQLSSADLAERMLPDKKIDSPSVHLAFVGDKLLTCAELRSRGVACSWDDTSVVQLLSASLDDNALAQRATALAQAESPSKIANALIARGKIEEQSGNYARASRIYSLAVTLAPQHELALYQAAKARLALQEEAEAAALKQQLLKLGTPLSVELLKQLGGK